MVFNRDAPPRGSVAELLTQLLDRRYTRTTETVIRAIAGSSGRGVIERDIQALRVEAARLDGVGERLRPTNAVFRTLIRDLETVTGRNAQALGVVAGDVQRQGIDVARTLTRQLALPGITDEQLRSVGIQWNTPDPEAVNALVELVDSPAFAGQLSQYGDNVVQTVINQAVRGMVEGWSPLRTANQIISMTENFPASSANTLLRTLQLQSYRSATAIHQQANSHIIEYVVRIAALDTRTCLACVALHGTRLEVGERVDDHHNGRCTSISKIKGRDLPMQLLTGERWFSLLPDDMRREIAGPANFNALQAGAVTLGDFVKPYDDALFGSMIREASLKGILGTDAAQYYERNQD